MRYTPKDFEKKWQDFWDEQGVFNAKNDFTKRKFYGLIEFPYPSAQGLHVGHPRSYTGMDIIARKKRLEGYNVLYPIGWDAFGLPTENHAIKTGIHPAIVTKSNVENFKRQCKSLGFSFDWSREVNTTDPAYFKWTQWIFLKLFEKGLAYKTQMPVNWCTSCQVGLANEEVVNGVCERCGGEVVRKVKSQWMLKITEYADKLIEGLDEVDFLDKIKAQQTYWIGRSEGAEVDFKLSNIDYSLRVFTTRADTLFGATYMVISPEHPLIEKFGDKISNLNELRAYREEASRKSEFERTEVAKDKTGVEIKGIRAINPVTEKEIPIWVSDYVLMTYGTGAIMAVPAHDDRDWAFAKKFDLPIIEVVGGGENLDVAPYTDVEDGIMVNSGFLTGLKVKDAIEKMKQYLEENGIGKRKVNYKLRDWVFSRQRYWGEPIPLVNCEKCGWVKVPESELPLTLPDLKDFKPTEDGESPLAKAEEWINTTCPCCGGKARRETDTMPQWAGSSWYFLRYIDPANDKEFANKELLKYWLPIDWYNGGMEHTTLHLLYSRFWHRFLYDIGLVPTKEPYQKRTSQGMILGENNEKMSKSRGNVVNPDDIINEFGTDTMRVYEMFMGDFSQAAPWSSKGVIGCRKFLDRVWNLQEVMTSEENVTPELERDINLAIKKVSEDIEKMKFNTAIASLMSLLNTFYAKGSITRGDMKVFLILLNPMAPHITEEIWYSNNFGGYVHEATWPICDESKLIEDEIEVPIQVNGKLKAVVKVKAEATQDEIMDVAKGNEIIASQLDGKEIVKVIFVKGRIFNIVVK